MSLHVEYSIKEKITFSLSCVETTPVVTGTIFKVMGNFQVFNHS